MHGPNCVYARAHRWNDHQSPSPLTDINPGFVAVQVFQWVTHGASDGFLRQFTATATVPRPYCVYACAFVCMVVVVREMNTCPVH